MRRQKDSYDADGERTVKMHGGGQHSFSNGMEDSLHSDRATYTLYPNAFLTYDEDGQYVDRGDGSLLKQSERSSSAIDPLRQRTVPPDPLKGWKGNIMAEPSMRGNVEQRNIDALVEPIIEKYNSRNINPNKEYVIDINEVGKY